MSSKKKSRPLFEVPVEVGSGRESGWVYRSGTPEKEGPQAEAPEKERAAPRESSEAGIGAESMHVLTLALTTLAHTFSLAFRISVMPMTIGIRALRSLARADGD